MINDIEKRIGTLLAEINILKIERKEIDEKIKSSEYMLKYTDYSLQEISSFCAFSSQSRFSAYFQRKNGITPAKYRKKYQKGRNE